MKDELLRIGTVAEMIGVAAGTIHSWRYKGTAPPGFPLGFRLGSDATGLRWKRSEVEAFIAARHATQTKASA
ncbi:helix-turn-helix transcriptional regulator [Tenggerimyces flavus]|uniref:Helix-turn-helix transcriptional regulator n=1 Tax=Tenggerimyces flavus TaxID=1708749 RepID=A0ABV7YDC0_9ACTN|nr:hypothetical protein [Tenggerimyces flavus]MBM7788900.1 putative DNA-binding transcriptional regulator AlpA [Tenggerimyces flavus]